MPLSRLRPAAVAVAAAAARLIPRALRSPSGALVERIKTDPIFSNFLYLTNIIALPGALPIKVDEDVIGAAGASGAPGGDKDEAWIKAGLDKAADQLK